MPAFRSQRSNAAIARCALVSLCLLVPRLLRAQQTTSVRFDESRARRVDSIFAPLASGGSPGCAVAIIEAGRVRYSRGYGLADVAAGTAITPGSVFGLASLSKTFTAMSILLLAKDGRLALDDDVHRWVSQLPDYHQRVTIRELLHHTSGIPNYYNAMVSTGWTVTDPLTGGQVLDWLKDRPLDFPPGSHYRYSNTGYMLLEMIVKRASGLSLKDFAAQRIFGPLGMTRTQFIDDHRTRVPHLANAYISRGTVVHGDQALVPNGPEWQAANPRTSIVGDAGVYSTVEDLARWDGNFYTGRVGGRAVLDTMQQAGMLTSGDTDLYASGLFLGAYRGLRTIGHPGGWSGYQSSLFRYADQRFTIAILCNRRWMFEGIPDPSHRIAEIYLGDQMVGPDVGPLMATVIKQSGIDSAVHLYCSLRARYQPILFDEQQLNGLGYDLLRHGKVDAAIAMFRLNAEMYPNSANTYDSLGEAYADHGDRTLAIANYEQSLTLDSTNANAVMMLKKLRAQRP